MNIAFDPKGDYIGIGEDHVGSFAFNFSDDAHIKQLKDFLTRKTTFTFVDVYYEGPNEKAKSQSYKNFVKQLNGWLKANKTNLTVRERGWERDLNFPKDIEYSTILLGPEPQQVISLIGRELNGKQSLLDAIVKCGKFKGTQNRGPSKEEVIAALSDGTRPSDVLQLMMKEDSATAATVRSIYGGMRDKYFEGSQNAAITSPIYRRVNQFNEMRDRHLAKKMKSEGGIFLAGDDHIRLVKQYLR